MGSQHSRRFTCAQAECEIFWKPDEVSPNGLIQYFGRHPVEVRKIEVDDHAPAAD
jgi:hypothetical protein